MGIPPDPLYGPPPPPPIDVSARNAASRGVPRALAPSYEAPPPEIREPVRRRRTVRYAVAVLAALTLAFGGDQIAHVKGMYWTRALWQQAMAANGSGTLPPFRYYAVTPPYTQYVTDAAGKRLKLRCRMYGGAGAVHIVCVFAGAAGPKA